MKIGIMGAMPEEIDAIRDAMLIKRETVLGTRTYCEGSFADSDVVMVFSRWGKVAAASTATTLIQHFGVDLIVFSGVAGAVADSLNVGDIVIGCGLYQHDMDARPVIEQFQIPLTDKKIFKANSQILANAKIAAEEYVAEIDKNIASETLAEFLISKPKVIIGSIASGDQFVSNASTLETLSQDPEGNQVHAVEMEGAAVAQICHDYDTDLVVIRTISDKADHSAHIDFPAFVNKVASKYSVGIIARFIASYKSQ